MVRSELSQNQSPAVITKCYFMPNVVSKEEGEDIDAGVGDNKGK